MNTFDTVALELPLTSCQINGNAFFPVDEYGTVYQLKKQLKTHGISGRKGIEYNTFTRKLIIEISSKLLGRDYLQLINTNTLEDLYNRLMQLQLFTCSQEAFRAARVLRCDVTKDLYIENISDVLGALQCFTSPVYRASEPYTSTDGKLVSIAFNKVLKAKSKENKMYIEFYDKGHELQHSRNKPFLQSLGKEATDLHIQAHNLFRIEAKIKTFTQISSLFKIHSNTLQNLLESKTNTISTIMRRILSAAHHTKNPAPINPATLNKKELLHYWALQANSFDVEAIRAAYKAIDPKNVARDVKPIQELAARLRTNESVCIVNNLMEQIQPPMFIKKYPRKEEQQPQTFASLINN